MAQLRELIHVSGADALSYLQGQLSADVLSGPGSRWSLLLEPNGKLGWLLLVNVGEGRATISIEAGQAEAVLARLRRFMLRTDATYELEQVRVQRARLTGEAPEGAWVHRWCGVDLVDHFAEAEATSDEDEAALRIGLGLPSNDHDLSEELFASALGPEALVSSSSGAKGCYVGQELVARTTSRSATAPIVLVRVAGNGATPAPGAALRGDGGEELGELTTVVGDGSTWRALARLRRAGLGAALACDGIPVSAETLS